MAETPDNKPEETTPAPPAAGEKVPQTGPDGKPVRIIDTTKGPGSGWQSHRATQPAGQTKKKTWFSRPIIIGPIALLLVIGLGIGTVFFLRKPSIAKALNAATGIDLQSVGAGDLSKVQAGNVGKPNETLTISANTNLKGPVTVGDTLTIQGATTSKGIINALGGLNVSGAITFDSITSRGALNVAGSSTLQGDVNINNLLTVRQALNVLGNGNVGGGLSVGGSLSVGGTLTAQSLQVQDFTINDTINVGGHIVTSGNKPSAVVSVFAGSGASASVEGNDIAGTIIIDTGTTPAIGNLATFTFAKTYGTVPKVLLTPVGQFSARLQYYTSKTPQNFTLFTNTVPTAATAYTYDYFVIE